MMKKGLCLLIMIFASSVFLVPACFADKGVFQPKAVPDEIFNDRLPATITVTAEIGDVPQNHVDVNLCQTTEGGTFIRLLSPMRIDISQGGFYTGQFEISEKKPRKVYFKIIAVYNNKEHFESPVQDVTLYDPLPKGSVAELAKVLKGLEAGFRRYRSQYDLDAARHMVLKDAQENPDITMVSLNGRNLSIRYKNAINGIALLDDPASAPVD